MRSAWAAAGRRIRGAGYMAALMLCILWIWALGGLDDLND